MTDESRRNDLRGRENILAWLTRLETINSLDNVIIRNLKTDKIELVKSEKSKPNELD
jgi:hypothetical protein